MGQIKFGSINDVTDIFTVMFSHDVLTIQCNATQYFIDTTWWGFSVTISLKSYIFTESDKVYV